MAAIFRLNRGLAKQVAIAGEGVKQLVVQVVSVGNDHHRGIFHVRVANHLAGVEDHGQALARALGVPNHANAPIAKVLITVVDSLTLFNDEGVRLFGLSETGKAQVGRGSNTAGG